MYIYILEYIGKEERAKTAKAATIFQAKSMGCFQIHMVEKLTSLNPNPIGLARKEAMKR
jgi:hypothetical protein